MQSIYLELLQDWSGNCSGLIKKKLGIEENVVRNSLQTFTQAGKVIYDLKNNLYRVRELKREGIDIKSLRFTGEIDKKAYQLLEQGAVTKLQHLYEDNQTLIASTVSDRYLAKAVVDENDRIVDGNCTCDYF